MTLLLVLRGLGQRLLALYSAFNVLFERLCMLILAFFWLESILSIAILSIVIFVYVFFTHSGLMNLIYILYFMLPWDYIIFETLQRDLSALSELNTVILADYQLQDKAHTWKRYWFTYYILNVNADAHHRVPRLLCVDAACAVVGYLLADVMRFIFKWVRTSFLRMIPTRMLGSYGGVFTLHGHMISPSYSLT